MGKAPKPDAEQQAPTRPTGAPVAFSQAVGNGSALCPPSFPEDQLRELLENANDMIYVQDLEANFTWVNQAALGVTGYSMEEALSMNMVNIVAPEFVELAARMRLQHREGGPNSAYQVEIIAKDGRRIPVEVSSRLIYRDGQPIGVQGTARDITERLRAKESSSRNEERFRSLVQNSSDVITIYDANGVIRYESPAVERVMGYKPEELVGRNAFENVHPDDLEMVRTSFCQIVSGTAISNSLEFRYRHKNGSWRVLEATASNLLNDEAIGGIVTNCRDVTERSESDHALRNTERRLLLHAQQTLLGVIEFNTNFEIVEWNPAAENIFGYKRGDAIGRHADLIVPLRAREYEGRVRHKLAAEQVDVRSTNENITASGRVIICDWSHTPLVDQSGEIVGFVSLVQDVTEKRGAEEAVRRSEERYRFLFERNLAAVYWTTLDGEVVDCNESFAKMFGYKSRGEVILLRTLDFYQQVGTRERVTREIKLKKNLTNLESLCCRKDGSALWALQNLSLLEDGTGVPLLQGTMIDITERKMAEQSLRQAEGRFRSIFENAAEGIFQTSLDGRWLIVNPKLASILGYESPKELMDGVDVKTAYYVDPGRRREIIRQLERQGAVNGVESQVYRKDGQIIWVSESARSVRDAQGHLVGFEGTVQDITERKHAEDTLRQNERRLRRQNEILVELSQRKNIESGELDRALLEITEASAETLEVEHASIWLINPERTAIECADIYTRSARTHGSGKRYAIEDLPIYFEVINQERTIDADDVVTDPRTVEFVATLSQQGVTSMMDSTIRVAGEVVGVLCQEHVGPPRSWTLDEKNFSGSMADLASLAIEASTRRRAQDALRESESKFRAVAETAASAIYIHQGEKFLYCNRGSESISGYAREELMQLNPFELVHPDDRHFVRERFESRISGGTSPQRYEYRIVTKQGEVRWVDFSASLISFEGQSAMLGTAFDITERKRGEQLQSALYRITEKTSVARDLDEFFAAIHGILSELVYARNFYIALYDPRTQIISFPYHVDEQEPPPAPRKLGKGLTEYVFRTGRTYLNSAEQEQKLAALGEVELIGAPSVDWLGVPLKSGNETFGVLAMQSYSEDKRFGEREKEILTFVSQSVATAIQRKRDEDALRRSEARYRSQVQTAVYGIYRSSTDNRFLDVNPALVAMLGYDSAEELLALNLATDVYEDPSLRSRLLQEYRHVERIEGYDVQWKRKDGKVITVRLSGRAVLNDAGVAEGFEMLAEDITERRALEEQFRQSQKMEAVGRLAGGVAHDFNNLLTVIKGYSELMLDQLTEADPMRAEVQEVKHAADRAAALTRQLLAFSRKQVLAPKVLDLNAVFTNMEQLLRRLIGEDVELRANLDPSLGRTKADPSQTEQVIMNLAVNARDAMPGGGKLTVTTSNVLLDVNSLSQQAVIPGAYVRLDVTDSGTGMDAETRSRIFEPFFTTKEQGKGTGLGLSTVYGIVKQSGGYIDVQSELGRGTTFTMYLPRVDEAAEVTAKPVDSGRKRTGTETILIVEDEDGVRTLARQLLQKQGYTVLDTRNGGEALLACERHAEPIHLLLTDVILSQMSGSELAQRLSKLRPQMKVLFMSGYSGDAVAQRGIVEFGGAFLQKPFSTESLVAKVREVLDSSAPASARSAAR